MSARVPSAAPTMGSRQVCVVDLGGGNLRSVARALESLGASVQVSGLASDVACAERVVVPGQGAFGDGARALREGGIGDALHRFRERGRPFLGVCLGMQLLFARSEEASAEHGLGWVEGTVRRFPHGYRDSLTGLPLKVPHMGWNIVQGRPPWLPEQQWFYFVHSYYCEPANRDVVVGTSDYGLSFCAALAYDNVLACQFHPEKSHEAGWALLQAWLQQ
jgi:glutamine amidotransferase